MQPLVARLGSIEISAYSIFVLAAFVAGVWIRHVEVKRIGQVRLPGYRWVGVGCLLGAVVGAKLGMVLFVPIATLNELFARMADLDFTGKTVVGALVGGYLGVEIAKRIVGIRVSTGDGFAVAVPAGQAQGRLGCFFNGCCHGTASDLPWAVATLHPVQLYEAVLDAILAITLWSLRHRPYPRGHLFRRYLVGYALIRFVTEFVRGDAQRMAGPLTATQWLCLIVAAVFTGLIVRGERKPI